MGKKQNSNPKVAKQKTQQPPAWELAEARVANGPLFRLEVCSRIYCDDDYPMAKDDWAYVTSTADIYLMQIALYGLAYWQESYNFIFP